MFWYKLLEYTPSAPPPPTLPTHTDPNGLSPRQIKSDSDDDDLPNVTLDSVNETGSTALSIARAVQ
ncbi:Krueppel-like factor 12, partial [Ameca splendens]